MHLTKNPALEFLDKVQNKLTLRRSDSECQYQLDGMQFEFSVNNVRDERRSFVVIQFSMLDLINELSFNVLIKLYAIKLITVKIYDC